jgi:DNA-binding LytR/AlgR family response regulator
MYRKTITSESEIQEEIRMLHTTACDDETPFIKKTNDSRAYHFVKYGLKRVLPCQVMYIENNLHKASFHLMENGEESIYNIYRKIDEIESDFESGDFVRIHQSFLVNMKYVCAVRRHSAILENGVELPISKQRWKQTTAAFIRHKGEI